jgi:hypothetical protein
VRVAKVDEQPFSRKIRAAHLLPAAIDQNEGPIGGERQQLGGGGRRGGKRQQEAADARGEPRP